MAEIEDLEDLKHEALVFDHRYDDDPPLDEAPDEDRVVETDLLDEEREGR